MQSSSVPIKIPTIWAASAPAGTGVITVPIPSQQGITPDAASWTDGYPPQTAQAGGYPRINDTNGALQMISAWARWMAAGGPIYYDAVFSAAIGGYPSGALLGAVSTLGNFWISTVDNNTSDPDTGGANWISLSIPSPFPANTSLQGALTLGSYQSISAGTSTILVTGTVPFGTVASGVITLTKAGIFSVNTYTNATITTSAAGNYFADPRILYNGSTISIGSAGTYSASGGAGQQADSLAFTTTANIGDTFALAIYAGADHWTSGSVTQATLSVTKVG